MGRAGRKRWLRRVQSRRQAGRESFRGQRVQVRRGRGLRRQGGKVARFFQPGGKLGPRRHRLDRTSRDGRGCCGGRGLRGGRGGFQVWQAGPKRRSPLCRRGGRRFHPRCRLGMGRGRCGGGRSRRRRGCGRRCRRWLRRGIRAGRGDGSATLGAGAGHARQPGRHLQTGAAPGAPESYLFVRGGLHVMV